MGKSGWREEWLEGARLREQRREREEAWQRRERAELLDRAAAERAHARQALRVAPKHVLHAAGALSHARQSLSRHVHANKHI
jgi:hypothetical protein